LGKAQGHVCTRGCRPIAPSGWEGCSEGLTAVDNCRNLARFGMSRTVMKSPDRRRSVPKRAQTYLNAA
jgi:hypothetical protein